MSRIAVVGMSNNRGGVETYLINFLRAMCSENQIVFINIDPTMPLAYADLIQNMGAKVFDAKGDYSLRSYFGRTAIARRIIQVLDVDYVYVNALTLNNAYWIKAANQVHVQSLYHSHSDAAVYSSGIKRIVSNFIRPYNRRILSQTKQLAASMEAAEFMFGDHNHSELVYNAVDPQKWRFNEVARETVKKKIGLKRDNRVIIVVARMHPQKNYPKILSVVKKVCESDPNYYCLIAGDGDQMAGIKQQIETEKLFDHIRILGQRKDIPELMWASDILLMPSIYEGLPFIAIEAQAAGLPVLVSKNVIPDITNITGEIEEESLSSSDTDWAQHLMEIVSAGDRDRVQMNHLVADSNFSFKYFSKQIRRIFS